MASQRPESRQAPAKASNAPARTTRMTRSAAAKAPVGRAPTVIHATPAKAATAKLTSAVTAAKPRKPLVNRDNTLVTTQKGIKSKTTKQFSTVEDADRELIKAYLRIRPNLGDGSSAMPYLKPLSPTTVQMTDPSKTRFRTTPQAQVYTFNHVFPPAITQSDFFTRTTLPLVRDLLSGQNGLVFTYGVTNSGKTYTIQGGSTQDTAGLLPRTLDVVFNSLDGLHSDAPYRPVRIGSIERILDGADVADEFFPLTLSQEKAIAEAFGEHGRYGTDSTTLKVDRNYEYAIWVSYAEVYNEKVYDLLEAEDQDDGAAQAAGATGPKKLPRSTSTWQSLFSLTKCQSTTSDVFLVKRKALGLKNDPDTGGKYAAGLRCVRVRTAEEAQRVLRAGNINRRVFGTLANAASSRSHGIFTLSCVRIHRGERIRSGGNVDEDSVLVSRLSIVDLAGSERSKNTQNTGERLKEAGSINKSLMVLGQCMEALRTNQRRLAASLAAPGRGTLDTGSGIPQSPFIRGPKLTLVPFRHSKLTELFQDFFVGSNANGREGAVTMIVNVNPYDTGFDENAHVMRFAAVAREIMILPPTTAPNAAPKATAKTKANWTALGKPVPMERSVTVSTVTKVGGRRTVSQARLKVVEEDEEPDSEGENSDANTASFVDALFDEIEELRTRLYDAEMRYVVVEAETREEVMHEMEVRMLNMEHVFAKRLMNEVEQNELKTDAKIDMLHQFGAFASKQSVESPTRPKNTTHRYTTPVAVSDEDDDEDDDELAAAELDGSTEHIDIDIDDDSQVDDASVDRPEVDDSGDEETPSSPLQHKRQARLTLTKVEKKIFSSGPEVIGLRDEDMRIDEVDADETVTFGEDDEDSDSDDVELVEDEDNGDDGDRCGEDDDAEESDEDYWLPSRESTPSSTGTFKTTASFKEANTPKPVAKIPMAWKATTAVKQPLAKEKPSTRGVSGLQRQLDEMTIKDVNTSDDDDEDEVEIDESKGKRRTTATRKAKSSTTTPATTAVRRSNRGKQR